MSLATIVGLPALIIGALIVSGCNVQNSLLYYPSSFLPSEESLTALGIRPWPSSIKDYRGLVGLTETRHTRGTVVVFHGNGGIAVDRVFYIEQLTALQYRVILAEYPRYGGRRGQLGEKAFVDDAGETVRLASEQFGKPLFLLGESLGCGVVAAVSKETQVNIDGIILMTPWDTLASVAQSKFPFLPVQLLLTDKYDNVGNLSSYKGRIAVVGAGRDKLIPIRHANVLYHSLSGAAKRMWTIQDAGHNDWPMFTNTMWWKEVMDFVGNNNDKGLGNSVRPGT